MIPVSEPNITEKKLECVTDAVKSTWILSTGKYIDRFESVFADYIGTKYVLTVSNGTVALHVALLSLGIGPGDEVIVPALAYIATANVVTCTGATPVFTDSEPDTWNMCPDSIERLITPKTKPIMAVHL
jgi:perosamine synthetase